MNTIEEQNLELVRDCPNYNKWIYSQFERYVAGDVLEVGVGVGNISELVLSDTSFFTGTDVNLSHLDFCKKRYKGKFLDIDISKTIKGLESYDVVLCLNVLEHIEYDFHAVRNMSKVLKPGGYLVLQLPAHPKLYNSLDRADGHYIRYDKKRIKNFLYHHKLKLVSLKSMNFPGLIGWWYHGSFLKLEKHKQGDLKLFDKLVPVFKLVEKIIPLPGLSYIVIAVKQ